MLILTFEDDEEDLLRNILSITDSGLNMVQNISTVKEVLSFKGLKIDVSKRVVYRGK